MGGRFEPDSVTRRLKFLVAIRPGITSPGLSARMASTFDRLSDGRLLINVVTGGDAAELEGDGVFVDHDTRYEITDEFLHIWRKLLSAAHTNDAIAFDGKHLASKGGKALYPPVQIRIRRCGSAGRRRLRTPWPANTSTRI